MESETKTVMDEMLMGFEERLKGFGARERSFQLTVKLKVKYEDVVMRMKSILDEQKKKKESDKEGMKKVTREATKADAVEQLLDLAEQVLDARQARVNADSDGQQAG